MGFLAKAGGEGFGVAIAPEGYGGTACVLDAGCGGVGMRDGVFGEAGAVGGGSESFFGGEGGDS